jgi:CubicO group peptidase (beta-lactamase class C family)
MRFLLQAIALALTVMLSAASLTEAQSENQAEIVRQKVEAMMAQTGFGAVSVAIVERDDIATYHFGQLSDGAAPDDETLYDIGSLTKTHTGLLLALAVSDGLLTLDDPVALYMPELDPGVFSKNSEHATIRHLATHVSGMPQDLACDASDLPPDALLVCFLDHDQTDLMNRLQSMELLSVPGEQYRYSNAAVRLLGVILERVYETSYDELLAERVFPRTGQTQTYSALTPEQHTRWQVGRQSNGEPAPDASMYFNAAGGLKSTAPDMGRYMRYYLTSGEPLARDAVTLLVGEPDGLGRAFIWNTFNLDTVGQLYHGGGTFGTSAWISIYPEAGLGIFMVTPSVTSTAQADLNGASNAIIAQLRDDN